MQKKERKKDYPVPTDKILDYNKKELRPIANRQIESLKKRRDWTHKFTFYNYYINLVILQEAGEI